MVQPILEADHLTLESNAGPIISDFSLQIHPGEIVALTGRSGIGKSSIALAILQLLPADIRQVRGTIKWSSRDASVLIHSEHEVAWAQLRGSDIGFIQQDVFGAFDPVLQMGSQMMMIIRERARNTNEDVDVQLKQKMEEVGLTEIDRLWKSYPHQLSGGQLQRCLIAMVIVIQPRLLISDEPTSAIDTLSQQELLQTYARVRDTYGMAMLIISHEEQVVRQLADRVIDLNEHHVKSAVQGNAHSPVIKTGSPVVVKVEDLVYTHAFGGILTKAGASVGPFTFQLRQGQCLGIVGPSGSGKSTLGQLMVGLLIPSKGNIYLGETQLDLNHKTDQVSLRSRVQLVMQDGRGALHPYRTIGDQLSEVFSLPLPAGRIQTTNPGEALKSVGLDSVLLNRLPGQLSGGECLRINIARALMIHPEALICDESTTSLDPETRDGILSLLNRLKDERGLTLVMISHDDHVMRATADQIIVLDNGKVVDFGPAATLMQFPEHPLTRRIFSRSATFRP